MSASREGGAALQGRQGGGLRGALVTKGAEQGSPVNNRRRGVTCSNLSAHRRVQAEPELEPERRATTTKRTPSSYPRDVSAWAPRKERKETLWRRGALWTGESGTGEGVQLHATFATLSSPYRRVQDIA